MPEGDLRRYYEPAVEAFADAAWRWRYPTAGLRKPAGENTRRATFLEMLVDAGCPLVLSSDAHVPDQLGYGYERASSCSRRPACARSPSSSGGSGGWSRSGEDRHRGRHARFAPGRRLVLGGVEIPFERGLAGHSDADVLAHAIIDALLGAAGLGDIGQHFPDTDERRRGADSMELLREVVAPAGGRAAGRARRRHRGDGGPKLGPHREAIAASLGAVLGRST